MKKVLSLLLAVFMVLALAGCSGSSDEGTATDSGEATTSEYKIAMVTDYGDITDESFNQATYEGCKDFAASNGLEFNYFKPSGDSTAERVAMIESAIDEGYNVIVTPGYAFGEALAQVSSENADVKFIALDVSAGDFGEGFTVPSNLYSMIYQEELCGYMAGVAAVKLGYTKLGFLGGMAVPAVVRYGYGFVQGADAAAKELGKEKDVTINYAYGNQFFGDADITAAMDTWYGAGTEVVFACGGGIYTSAAEAAAKVNQKVIGVDVDQAPIIDGAYGDDMTVTSAMKGLAASAKAALQLVIDGKWDTIGGKIDTLGIVSANPEENYVQIPMGSTQWADGFTQDDYKAIVAGILDGSIKVSNAIDAEPTTAVKVNYQGNIK